MSPISAAAAARTAVQLTTTPLALAIGATLAGVDLALPLERPTRDAIVDALLNAARSALWAGPEGQERLARIRARGPAEHPVVRTQPITGRITIKGDRPF